MIAKLRLLFLPLLCICFSSFAQNSELGVEWAHSFGSSRWEVTTALKPDHDGNIINIGFFSDTVDFDPGPGVINLISDGSLNTTLHGNVQGFLQKLDADGNLIWVTKYVEGQLAACCITHRETIVHVAPDNSILILSEGNQDVDFDPGPGVVSIGGITTGWVMQKFDSNGTFQWARTTNLFDYNGDATAIAMDANGDVYLGGTYDNFFCTNPVGSCNQVAPLVSTGDVPFVAKYNGATGQNIWFRAFEVNSPGLVTDDSDLLDIEIDPTTGDILVGGWYINDFQPEPSLIWNHDDYDWYGQPSDGEVIKIGFLLRLDESTGISHSSQEFFDVENEAYDHFIQDIGVDGAGNIYIAGQGLGNNTPAFLTKILDSSGTEIMEVFEGAYDAVTRNNILHVQPDGSFMINRRFIDSVEWPNSYVVNGHIAFLYGSDWVQERFVAINGPFYIYSIHRAYAAMNTEGEVFFAGGFHAGDYDADASPNAEYILELPACGYAVCMDAFVQKLDLCPAYSSSEDVVLCGGEDYTFPDGTIMTNLQDDVTHVSSFPSANVCDSTITTNVTVNPSYFITTTPFICEGQPYTFPDGTTEIITETNIGQEQYLTTVAGCDSTFQINVYVQLPPELAASYDCENDELVIDVTSMGTFQFGESPPWNFSANGQNFTVNGTGIINVPGVTPDQTWRLYLNEPNNCFPDILVYPECVESPCGGTGELLANGSFNNLINQVWVETSTFLDGVTDTGLDILTNNYTYNNSAGAAWFSGWNQGSINTIQQDVLIPTSPEVTNLTWWQFQNGGCQADDVFIITLDGQEIFSQTGAEDPNCGVWGWHLYTVDISSFANGTTYSLEMNYVQQGTNGGTNIHVDNVSILSCAEISGCTISTACNYDSNAVTDDGSCTFPGCNDALAMNYDATAGCGDGSCAYLSCEDFESYVNGNPIAETSATWNTWGELTSGTTAPFADDVNVTNVLSYSGSNALYFEAVGAGGPQDVVLPFGAGAPYETGLFEFSVKMHVVPATGAYFNFQAESTPGITWALDVEMHADGSLVLGDTGAGMTFLTSTYPQGQWFELELICDLTNNNWQVLLNGLNLGSFVNNANKIASLDLYPLAGHQFYVDDICWSHNVITGCMDSSACNYDPDAITDDGSCTYGSCPGCTDSTASNYNQNATVEDGSCYYFFLDTNGVTIKCINCVAGDTGEVNGTMYTAVDNTTLPGIIASGSIPMDQVCTTLMTTTQDLFWGNSSMNEDLSSWDMSNVTNTAGMFNGATSFDQPIGAWDMSNVTHPYYMFHNAQAFNQDISQWDMSSAVRMEYMFFGASAFNQDISQWDVSSVTRTQFMFYQASSFNSPLALWDMSQVTHAHYMFEGATVFNQPINDWDVSSIQNMTSMFALATSFNQPLDQWDVSGANNMTYMFWSAFSFNQDISNWCVSQIPVQPDLYASGAPLLPEYYPQWGTCPTPCAGCFNVTFRLDLSEAPPEIINPEVNGFFNDWCGNCNPLTDIDGDDVWETTLQLTAGEHIWKFSSNNWQNQEYPVSQLEAPCFIWDQFGFVNRTMTITGDTVLPVYCWESCNACGVEDEIVNEWVCPGNPYTFPDGSVAINIQSDTTQYSFNPPGGNYIITNLYLETLLSLTSSYDCENDELIVEILDLGGFQGGPSPAWDFSANGQVFNVTNPGTFIVPGVTPDQTWRLSMFETNNCSPDFLVYPECVELPCEGAAEQVDDGDFEDVVNSDWGDTVTFLDGPGGEAYTVIYEATGFNDSPKCAWFGGFAQGSICTIDQEIYLPLTTEPTKLTWWQWYAGTCATDDFLEIYLDNNLIFSQNGSEFPNCGEWNWFEHVVDISPYTTGDFYDLEITFTSNSGGSNLFIDNVSTFTCPCPPDITQQTVQVCPGDSYTFPDGTVIENITEGFVQYSYSSPPPCLVGIETTVEVGEHSPLQFHSAPVCHGDDYTYLDGTVINNVMAPVGSYLNILVNASGCDSAIVETAVYQSLIEMTVQDTICYIGSYTFPDGFYDDAIFTSMEYVSTLTSVLSGCDSLVTTDLHVRPPNPGPLTFNDVCFGGSFTFADGETQDNLTEGFGYQTFDFDIHGCDSITLEFIQIIPVFEANESFDVCEGSGYTFPDGIFVPDITDPFVHTSIFQTELGCDSLIHTTINVIPGGCMDSEYCNYDPAALCDDGSCCSCAADLDNDGFTNTSDMLIMLTEFGCMASCGVADLNDDLIVNSSDILIFLTFFGSSCFAVIP